MADIRKFFELVVPWPNGEGSGYVNLHWTSPNKKDPKRSWFNGTPFTNVEEFLSRAGWLVGKPDVRDIYFCTSLQSAATTGTSGKPRAVRDQRYVLGLRSLFYDLDAKNYASKKDAIEAFGKFLEVTGLPFPTAIVDSGGGYHIYWALRETLSRNEWQPYANGLRDLAEKHGLLIDGSVTIDSARVLRVPGTFNLKQSDPRPVKLGHVGDPYDIGVFNRFREVKSLPSPDEFAGLTPRIQGMLVPEPELSTRNDPLPTKEIFKGCGFLRNALETGGKEYGQPAWHLTTLASTFMADGHTLCHRMSNQHPQYSQEETDRLWERKLKDREEKGLGWPSCRAVQDAGSTSCRTCPHFAAGKTPLHLAISPPKPVATDDDTAERALCLPPGAKLINGIINWVDYDKKGNEEYHPLFLSRIDTPWAQRNPSALNFRTTVDKGEIEWVRILGSDMKEGLITGALLDVEVKYVSKSKRYLEGFFLAWLEQLHQAAKATKIQSLGWWMPDGNTAEGFVYGGKLYLPGGEAKPAATDPSLIEDFTPRGDIEFWFEACRLITNQNRPELEIIVLSGVASALIKMSGQASTCLSIWSMSGTGKSTAFQTSLAIWAHPLKSKDVETSTEKGLLGKAGLLGSLPIYLDDINDAKRQDTVIKQVFGRSQGTDATRMRSNLQLVKKRTWSSMLVISSNRSFAERVMMQQPDHDAGVKRVFEYKMDRPGPDRKGKISTIDADRIFARLQANFGRMGERVARYLADHIQEVEDRVVALTKQFEKQFKIEQDERFWTTFVGATVVAGEILNELGCEFHLPGIREFLEDAYLEQRARMKVDFKNDPAAMLGEFFRAHHMNIFWTNGGGVGSEFKKPGKPHPVSVVRRVASTRDAPLIHCDQEARIIRFYRSTFNDWLRKQEISIANVMVALKQRFIVKTDRAAIAKGTGMVSDSNHLLQINIGYDKDNPFYDLLFAAQNSYSEMADSPPLQADGSSEAVPASGGG